MSIVLCLFINVNGSKHDRQTKLTYFMLLTSTRITSARDEVLGTFENRPFPSSIKSLFQSEAKCEAIDMKMIFNYDANKTHFHNKGFALSLVLKVRCFGTRKWPI